MRAVIDTNVLISALISLSGAPAAILARWRAQAFVLVMTTALFRELERVAAYPHLRPLMVRSGASTEDRKSVV